MDSRSSSQVSRDEDLIYESIGSRVLEMWDPTTGESSKATRRLLRKLNQFLTSEPNELPKEWRTEFLNIIDQLGPTEFAMYGRDISRFLLKTEKTSEVKVRRNLTTNPKRKYPMWLPTLYESDSD